MTECMHCIVSGWVQGVGYRAATRRKAAELALAGWVRNLPDGTVEVYAQGAVEAVAALRGWLRTGPPGAKVAQVQCREAAATEGLTGFEVRR
jgi:acylphosphatase